jgi:hypothetical protein
LGIFFISARSFLTLFLIGDNLFEEVSNLEYKEALFTIAKMVLEKTRNEEIAKQIIDILKRLDDKKSAKIFIANLVDYDLLPLGKPIKEALQFLRQCRVAIEASDLSEFPKVFP